MIWKIQWSLLSQAKFSQKYPRFNEVTWKFALLLSWAEVFAKIRWWWHFKIWTCPIMTRWSVHENEGPFYTFTSKYDLPLYYELKCLQKCPRFNEATWKFELSLLSGGNFFATLLSHEIFAKIRLNRTALMSLEKFICHYHHNIALMMKFPRKKNIIRNLLENLICP